VRREIQVLVVEKTYEEILEFVLVVLSQGHVGLLGLAVDELAGNELDLDGRSVEDQLLGNSPALVGLLEIQDVLIGGVPKIGYKDTHNSPLLLVGGLAQLIVLGYEFLSGEH
jgi:hypothetical protein